MFHYSAFTMLLFLYFCSLGQIFAGQSKIDSAKTVRTPSITVSSTTADKQSTVTFSDISSEEIQKTYTVQDIDHTLSMLTSIYSVSQNVFNIYNFKFNNIN